MLAHMLPAHLAVLRPVVDPRYLAHVGLHPEPADALFGSPTAAAIVSFLALRPGVDVSMTDLELRTGASYESLHRTVRRLECSAVLRVDRSGRAHSVTMPRDDTAVALRALTLRLGPLGSRLRWAQRMLGPSSLDEAFVFGSLATHTERPDSDIDLFVVGDVSPGTLLSHMGGLADTLGRVISPVCRRAADLDRAMADGLSFVTTVCTGPRIAIVDRASPG
jgi:predicted nucleotidyltransferase